MNRYILRRIVQMLPVLFGITIITFTFTELAPGDAVAAMIIMNPETGIAGDDGSNADELRKKYGLDKPAPVRYAQWMAGLMKGHLGVRIRSKIPVSEEIARRMPATLRLMAAAMFISIALGIPLGIFSALRQYTPPDYALTFLTFIGISVPGFFAAIAAIYLFSLKLGWLPTSGYTTIGKDFGFWGTMWDRLRYLALPATVLGLETTAGIMRYTRSSVLEVVRLDYITVARSKGLSERVITLRHILRNALLPVITVIGLRLPSLFGGTIIIETIFNWPGMGILYLDGVKTRDYPLIMGLGLVTALTIVLSNLITDLTYGSIDPRIRYE
jgi:peptide/nickel transport system permease protein